MTTQAEIKYRWNIWLLLAGAVCMVIGTAIAIGYHPAKGPSTEVWQIGTVYIKSIWLWLGFLLIGGETLARILGLLIDLRAGKSS